ncbi:hypothetical protein FJZ19_03525 [Candidatus Pacearchaeota archaeon]|nr:hypothetical protein [Candidatus Pacearchaeota archaeon]
MNNHQQYDNDIKERENSESLCRNIRGFALYLPIYTGFALPFVFASARAAGGIMYGERIEHIILTAGLCGLAGLVTGSVVAIGGCVLGGLADADSGADD